MLQQAFISSSTEDVPFQTSTSHTEAGEIRFFGIAHVSYEKFILILLGIAISAFILKLVLKKYYKDHR